MSSVRKTVTLAAIALLLGVSPALGDVTVGFDQPLYVVGFGETFDVDIVATFTEDISAWGLDFTIDDETVAALDSFAVSDPPWTPVLSSLDGDLLGGLIFGSVGPGTHTLATLTLTAGLLEGETGISLSYNDEDEGFLQTDDGLDVVEFIGARIIVPEPASLALLALGGIALLRRR